MEEVKRALLIACAVVAGAASAREKLLPGDRAHAGELWRVHCAGCHGADGEPTLAGKSLGGRPLKDPALLDARTDEQLLASILKGGPGAMPAFGRFLSSLDAADLIALLRAPLPSVEDVFPDAAAYTVQNYTIKGSQLARAENLGGGIPAAQRELAIFSVYAGERPALGPRLVAHDDHVGLDDLHPKAKLGYLVFGPLPGPQGEPGIAALALSREFAVARLLAGPGAGDLDKLAQAVRGKGARDPGSRRPFVYKKSPEQAAALTRLYARAVEVAALAAKDESDRHLFDPPDTAPKKSPAAEPGD